MSDCVDDMMNALKKPTAKEKAATAKEKAAEHEKPSNPRWRRDCLKRPAAAPGAETQLKLDRNPPPKKLCPEVALPKFPGIPTGPAPSWANGILTVCTSMSSKAWRVKPYGVRKDKSFSFRIPEKAKENWERMNDYIIAEKYKELSG